MPSAINVTRSRVAKFAHLSRNRDDARAAERRLRSREHVVEAVLAKLEEDAEIVRLDAAAQESDDVVVTQVGQNLHLDDELVRRLVADLGNAERRTEMGRSDVLLSYAWRGKQVWKALRVQHTVRWSAMANRCFCFSPKH
eukprot:6187102-Pleurochrysis_carterae.AAC.1